MILGGRDEGALREVLVIAAALGLQDPRERPLAAQQQADEAHRKFRDEGSDFASYLKLWAFWQEARARSSQDPAATSSAATTSSRSTGCASGRTSTRSSSA